MSAYAPSQQVMQFLARSHKLLIGDRWRDPLSERTFDVLDPASGQIIAKAPEGDQHDVDLAVAAARQTFESGVWKGLTAESRMRILWKYSDLIEKHSDELAELDVLDCGMPLAFARLIVASGVSGLRYAAGQAANIFGSNMSGAISGDGREVHAYTAWEPVGVAALITPWNGPVGCFLAKVTPALAAGCSCILKPAENTPLSALRLGELALEAGLPPGVLNIVTGFGPTAGQALVEHPGVDKVSFTGSTAVGKRIVQLAAGNLKRVTLELGGKSPCIILDDADMDIAVPCAAMAIFANSGQLCIAGSRLFVQKGSFDSVVARLSEFARALKIGNGFDPTTQLGPVVSAKQQERIQGYIESGRQNGAEIVVGGGLLPGPGYFMQPTILANVNSSMRVFREEIFGPVLVVTPVDDLDEIVRKANDTPYGLAAGIFTRDVNKAHRIASRIRAGNVWVNCYGATHPTMPFGGLKESGWGREFGIEGLKAFMEKKSVTVELR